MKGRFYEALTDDPMVDVITEQGSMREVSVDTINVVFDGPPGHEPGRFVEVEDEVGNGVRVGKWEPHPLAVVTPEGEVLDFWHLQFRVVADDNGTRPEQPTTGLFPMHEGGR